MDSVECCVFKKSNWVKPEVETWAVKVAKTVNKATTVMEDADHWFIKVGAKRSDFTQTIWALRGDMALVIPSDIAADTHWESLSPGFKGLDLDDQTLTNLNEAMSKVCM